MPQIGLAISICGHQSIAHKVTFSRRTSDFVLVTTEHDHDALINAGAVLFRSLVILGRRFVAGFLARRIANPAKDNDGGANPLNERNGGLLKTYVSLCTMKTRSATSDERISSHCYLNAKLNTTTDDVRLHSLFKTKGKADVRSNSSLVLAKFVGGGFGSIAVALGSSREGSGQRTGAGRGHGIRGAGGVADRFVRIKQVGRDRGDRGHRLEQVAERTGVC